MRSGGQDSVGRDSLRLAESHWSAGTSVRVPSFDGGGRSVAPYRIIRRRDGRDLVNWRVGRKLAGRLGLSGISGTSGHVPSFKSLPNDGTGPKVLALPVQLCKA